MMREIKVLSYVDNHANIFMIECVVYAGCVIIYLFIFGVKMREKERIRR